MTLICKATFNSEDEVKTIKTEIDVPSRIIAKFLTKKISINIWENCNKDYNRNLYNSIYMIFFFFDSKTIKLLVTTRRVMLYIILHQWININLLIYRYTFLLHRANTSQFEGIASQFLESRCIVRGRKRRKRRWFVSSEEASTRGQRKSDDGGGMERKSGFVEFVRNVHLPLRKWILCLYSPSH